MSGNSAGPQQGGEGTGRPILQAVPLYLGDGADLLPGLFDRLRDRFLVEVEQRPPGFDPELAFDDSRGQYNSRILLAQLLRDLRPGRFRILGVAGVDLFIPVLTYVFGEAQLDGPAAVVSIHRLSTELYGLAPDPLGLADRLAKEAIHELGHTCGLLHCHDGRCVMASSTYVEEIDLKSDRFCDRCLVRLRAAKRQVWTHAPRLPDGRGMQTSQPRAARAGRWCPLFR